MSSSGARKKKNVPSAAASQASRTRVTPASVTASSTTGSGATTLPAEKLVRVLVTLDSPLDVRPSPLALHASRKSHHHHVAPSPKSSTNLKGSGSRTRHLSRQQLQQEEMMDSGMWDASLSGTIPIGRLKTKALAFFLANDEEAAEKLSGSYRLLSVDEGGVLEEGLKLNNLLEQHAAAKTLEMILLKNGMRSLDTGDSRDMEKGPTNLEILKATTGVSRANLDRIADPPYSMLEMQLQMRRIFTTLLESACKLQSKDFVVVNLLIQTQERLVKKVDEFPDLDPDKLKTLTDMGFERRRAAQVLAMTRQNVRNAASWLLKYPRQSGAADRLGSADGTNERTASESNQTSTADSAPRTGAFPTRSSPPTGKRPNFLRGRGRAFARTGFFSPHSPRVFAGSPLSQSPFVTGTKSTKEPQSPQTWDGVLQDVIDLMNKYHEVHFVPHFGMMRSLVEMGFPEDHVEHSLRLTGNKRGAALELLLANKGKYAHLYEKGLKRDNPVITAIFKQPIVQLALLRQKTVAALLNLLEAPMTLQIWMTDPEVNGFLGSVIRVFHAEKHHMDKDIEEVIANMPPSPPPGPSGAQQQQQPPSSDGPTASREIVATPDAPRPTPVPPVLPASSAPDDQQQRGRAAAPSADGSVALGAGSSLVSGPGSVGSTAAAGGGGGSSLLLDVVSFAGSENATSADDANGSDAASSLPRPETSTSDGRPASTAAGALMSTSLHRQASTRSFDEQQQPLLGSQERLLPASATDGAPAAAVAGAGTPSGLPGADADLASRSGRAADVVPQTSPPVDGVLHVTTPLVPAAEAETTTTTASDATSSNVGVVSEVVAEDQPESSHGRLS